MPTEHSQEVIEWARDVVRSEQRAQRTYAPAVALVAQEIVDSLPSPTLRERAYKVVHPDATDPVNETYWYQDASAIGAMAGWLYKNEGDRGWNVRAYSDGAGYRSYYTGPSEYTEQYFDSLVDAYAHVVVGLGESS